MTSLEQKIYSINYLNKRKLETLNKIKDEFKLMEGAKVQLSGGDKSKKWTLKSGHDSETVQINGSKVHLSYQYWFVFSYRNVQLRHKVCISGGSYDVSPSTAFCQYNETTDYIGSLENQLLIDVNDIDRSIESAIQEIQNPLIHEEFETNKEQYQKALNTLSLIKDKVHYSLRDYLPRY